MKLQGETGQKNINKKHKQDLEFARRRNLIQKIPAVYPSTEVIKRLKY
jgi:hypothetical protein